MEKIVGDIYGLVHLITSLSSLLFGTLTLILQKGTPTHVKIGYAYVISMSITLITAFMIYRLFNGFGMFHYTAIISVITLALGIIPAVIRKPDRWKYLHFTFMYWSVIGLYAAFAAETLVRIPDTSFNNMVGLAIGGIMLIGGTVFGIKRSEWQKQFK